MLNMRIRKHCIAVAFVVFGMLPVFIPGRTWAQTNSGTIQGVVTFQQGGQPLHNAKVFIVQLGRSVESDEAGMYRFERVPDGTYDLVVTSPALSSDRQTVQVSGGGSVTADFQMRIASRSEQITVTASGREETLLDSFQSTSVVGSIQLVEDSKASLGEVLDGQPGVAKRSSGPGSSRPVIRGFDGDRVAIMKDGMPTGALSSQSGDHGETIASLNLDRLEVVKGPATLLYGSNAIGGVVNAITSHGEVHEHPHPGFTGYLSGTGGTANSLGGGSAGLQYGAGNWLFWADVGGQRTGNYHTPIGEILNSQTQLINGGGGLGRYMPNNFFNLDFKYEDSVYGIPPAGEEVVHLALRKYDGRFTGGFQNLDSFVQGFRATLNFTNYHHEELSEENVANTTFDNKVFSYRGVFDQRMTGPLTGSFGFSGFHRNYDTSGEEAIAPPTNVGNIAFFTLQEIGFEHFRLQFGGRLDHTAYSLQVDPSPPLRDRAFTGFSGAAGINVPLWQGGAFVANYTHSYRTPALEELYNNGPHPGNATFEIGDSNLTRERADGIDVAVRHQSARVRAEANFFYYHMDDFIFLAPTGNIEDDLTEAEYLQAGSRFWGSELNFDAGLHENIWLLSGLDYVNAELTSAVASRTTGFITPSGTPLPRIPPLRGHIGLDVRYKGLSIRPETVMVGSQDRAFITETRTPGYTVFNLNSSYTVAGQHAVHVFSVSAFNLGNRLYRNHLSFIKDIAPEIGRGVRFGYTVRFM